MDNITKSAQMNKDTTPNKESTNKSPSVLSKPSSPYLTSPDKSPAFSSTTSKTTGTKTTGVDLDYELRKFPIGGIDNDDCNTCCDHEHNDSTIDATKGASKNY